MSSEKYCELDGFISYIETDSNSSVAQRLFHHRGKKYKPRELGGEGDYIADTGINLMQTSSDLSDLKEFDDFDCSYIVPRHKLEKTAFFYVTNQRIKDTSSEIVLSGRIVPFSPINGIPMENRKHRIKTNSSFINGFDWTNYMNGRDNYLIENDIIMIDPFDSVEIGRLCRSNDIKGPEAKKVIALGFKTLHKFLEEIGVNNYFDAAMDDGKRNYATLYEGVGMRRVAKYSCETVIKIEKNVNGWNPIFQPITYWAQHMNIPHTKERIKREFFLNNPCSNKGAKISKELIMFIAPYLFSD